MFGTFDLQEVLVRIRNRVAGIVQGAEVKIECGYQTIVNTIAWVPRQTVGSLTFSDYVERHTREPRVYGDNGLMVRRG